MSSLTRYSATDLRRFLEALADALEEPCEVVLIGGSAGALAYGVSATTVDIDTLTRATNALQEAAERARSQTGLDLPVAHAGTAQVPEGYRDRLVRIELSPELLTVFVLERHDLVISKALRADERDRAHILEIHAHAPLDFETLTDRFATEMLPIYVGDPVEVTQQFLWIIEELFGELRAIQAERLLKAR